MKGEIMPIKDPAKRREYQRELMRKKRQGLTENVSSDNFVSPRLDPVSLVSPKSEMLDPAVSFVRPEQKKLDRVSPVENVRPETVSPDSASVVSPCQLNHHSLSELFKQATEQVQQAWKEIRSQQGAEQCHNCYNSQRNHQLALNLLEKYWIKVKRLEKEQKPP